MKRFLSPRRLRRFVPVMLAAAGAVGGYLYYRYVGCVSGSCPTWSNPYLSAAYGAVIGWLLGILVGPEQDGKTP